MDYGDSTTLYKYQWDNIHDPESNFALFDEEGEGALEGGAAYVVNIPDEIIDESEPSFFVEDDPAHQLHALAIWTPSGKAVKISQRIRTKYYPTGSVVGFTRQMEDNTTEKYIAVITAQDDYRAFHGYVNERLYGSLIEGGISSAQDIIEGRFTDYFTDFELASSGEVVHTRATKRVGDVLLSSCSCSYDWELSDNQIGVIGGSINDRIPDNAYEYDCRGPASCSELPIGLDQTYQALLVYTYFSERYPEEQSGILDFANYLSRLLVSTFGFYSDPVLEASCPTNRLNTPMLVWLDGQNIRSIAAFEQRFEIETKSARDCEILISERGNLLWSGIPADYNTRSKDYARQGLYNYSY